MKANIEFKDRHSKVTQKEMEKYDFFHFKNTLNSIPKEELEYYMKKHPQTKCTLCYKNAEERLKLFLHLDDRIIESDNPLICPHKHKESIPKCFHNRKIRSRPKSNITFRIAQTKNQVNINNNLIQELNSEIGKFGNDAKNATHEEEKSFNFYEKTKEEEKLKRLKEMNPYIYLKRQKTTKNIPFIMKNNRPWSGVSVDIKKRNNNDSFNFSQTCRNKNDFTSSLINFNKKRVNVEDVLIIHNSNIRKGYSQNKTNNSYYKQNLKLGNSHMFTSSSKTFHNPFKRTNYVYMKLQ